MNENARAMLRAIRDMLPPVTCAQRVEIGSPAQDSVIENSNTVESQNEHVFIVR